MLVRNITQKFDLPHEPGQWFVLRKLTGKQLRAAREVVADNALDKMRRMGGDVFKAVNEMKADPDEKKKKDPLRGYDLDNLLKSGIASWSYTDDKNQPVPCDDEAKATLDDKTERWAGEAILQFAGALDTEADAKNA